MSEVELKPCPFCGKKPSHFIQEGVVVCQATVCDVRPIADGVGEWNTRASGWISVDDRLPEIPATHCSNDEVVRVATKSGLVLYARPIYARAHHSEGRVMLSCAANGIGGYGVMFELLFAPSDIDVETYFHSDVIKDVTHWEPLPLPEAPTK